MRDPERQRKRDDDAATRDDELAELLAEVRRIAVWSRRLVGGVMAGGYTSVFRGAGLEFDTVREYQEGDDPRSVDQNVSARMGRPFVKTYVDERELSLLFLLDLSASMDGGFAAWSSRGAAARVCACLALAAVGHDDKVGLVAFDDDVLQFVPTGKGQGHALRLVRDVLALRARGRGTRMASALELVSRVVRKRSVVFVLSDFLEPPARWTSALSLCARRHDVIAVRILPPEDAALPAALLRLRDPEGGGARLVDGRAERVRAAYAECAASARREVDDALRRAGVDRMDVPVPRTPGKDAVARPILGFFRMRELRGTKR
ncbi:MAG: DUF58 domain-containing protein [Planctomycetes bacterium]|nr:DUF58 domain-containing protein [Planctomycetota bacterium]